MMPVGSESGMGGGLGETVGAPGAGSGGDAGVFGVRRGLCSPPGPEAEVLPVSLGCGVGVMPVLRRMREDSPALAPVPPQPLVPPAQLTWASSSACRGLRSPTRPLMVRCGRLCTAPAAGMAPSTSPGPPPAPPGPAPSHPAALDPARPLPARSAPAAAPGSGMEGAGAQRGMGAAGECGGYK